MPRILDFFAYKNAPAMKKRSKRGRKKTAVYTLRLCQFGRDSFVTLDPAQVARLAGVSEKTVYHWIAGTKTPSPITQALLEIAAGGSFPWHGWEGWRIDPPTGRLLAPNGYSFLPGELAGWSIQKQLIKALEEQNTRLRLQLEQLRWQVQEQAANNLVPFPKATKKAP